MAQNPCIASRKSPQQVRSNDLVAAVLEAAVQVLGTDGAARFTTARVAERAGVSVGSIYQYFPNKAAILFRLQSDEWRQTMGLRRDILEDTARPPLIRLRDLVHAFIRSECEEATIRIALNDAAPLYRDAPEAEEAHAASAQILHNFLREAAPDASDAARALAGDVMKRTLSAAGGSFSESPRTADEIEAFAGSVADMFCAYLSRLADGAAARRDGWNNV